MKITNIEIDNFLTIGSIKANLADKGLVLIQGENIDDTSQNSNGSGKSSFPDAISWALFGETARGETGDAVVNETAGKQCRVAVTIEDGSDVYTVARHRKHKLEKNRLKITAVNGKGEEINLTKGTDKLTQPIVDRIVGCSVDVFNAAIYSGQECMPDLPGMTDKDLKMLVEESAGVDQLQEAYTIANGRLTNARRELEHITSEQAVEVAKSELLKGQVLSLTQSSDEWKAKIKIEVKRLTTELKSSIEETKALKPKSAAEELKKLEAARDQVQAKIDGVAGEQDAMASLDKALNKAEYNRNGAENQHTAVCKLLETAKEGLASVGDEIGKPCDSCLKPYSAEDIEPIKLQRTEEVESLTLRADRFKGEFLQATSELNKAADDRDKFSESLTDISAAVEKLGKIKDAIGQRRSSVQRFEQALKATKKDGEYLASVKVLENPHEVGLEEAKTNLINIDEVLDELVVEIERKNDEVLVKETVAGVMSPSGVRAHILDTVTPFLNQRTAQYLSALTDGNITAVWQTITMTAKGEAREKFTIDVESAVGAKRFKGLSGGEKRKVRLACSMALQDLVASRASKPIDLYIADEIDDSVDESGLERLMGILHEKARERGTVLVISHNSLSDWISSSVTITKEGGKSTMKGSCLS